MFPIYNKIFDYSFIVWKKENEDTLHFFNDNFSFFYIPVTFKPTFIEPKRQDMS